MFDQQFSLILKKGMLQCDSLKKTFGLEKQHDSKQRNKIDIVIIKVANGR